MGHIPEGDRMQSRIMCLDDMVAKDSMVRIIDAFIEVVDLEALGFKNMTAKTLGRNSYSPHTFAKLYAFCYEEGIRSSRKIEKACKTNIEVMWLIGNLSPDFKTIADFRRDNIEALTSLFYEFTSFAESAGLFGKKIVAIDGTKIRASNSKRRNVSKKSARRRVDHHKAKAKQYLQQMDKEDDRDAIEELADKALDAKRQAEEAERFLSDMEDAGVTELSLTDPDARCMGKGRQGVQVAYNVQAAVDSEHHLITDFDITSRADDHGQLSNMAKRTQETMRKNDITFISDKGYYGADDLKVCKDAGIEVIVAPQAKSGERSGSGYTINNFTYNPATDSYLCPEGAELACKSAPDAKSRIYSNKGACLCCKALAGCRSSGYSYRRVTRRPENEILDWADERYRDNIELYALRQQLVEHPFGTVKHSMGGGHFLLRGTEKVRCETALLFMGYNLKRSLNVLGFDLMMVMLDEYASIVGTLSSSLSHISALFAPFHVIVGAIRAHTGVIVAVKRDRIDICLAQS